MVSPLRRVPFVKRHKRNQKVLPQHPAPSPRLGVPSLRHPSVGHRLRLASLAPPLDDCGCAAARYALPPDEYLHSAFCNGAGESKARSRSRSRSKATGELTLGLFNANPGNRCSTRYPVCTPTTHTTAAPSGYQLQFPAPCPWPPSTGQSRGRRSSAACQRLCPGRRAW